MIANITRRIRGSLRVVSLLPGQRKIARIPRAAVVRIRNHRIRTTVRYAANTVPYYREMFRERGIDPDRVCTAADLDRLPILEKSEVRKDPERFRSGSSKGQRAIPFVTSGTTGEPLTVYHDPDSIVANIAYCEPEKQVVREILGRRRGIRQLTIIYDTSTIRKIWTIYRELTFLPTPSEHSLLSINAPLEETIARINEYRPDVISGYGSYLEVLFRYVMAKQISMHLPELVNYGAENMSEPGHRLIRDHFGIPVISRYGAIESLRIAFMCPAGSGFHVRDDLCHVRIVDDDGHELPAGEEGQVVISNLVNRGSVLLNYRLGDHGVLAATPCPCGRQLPLITGLDGRVEDLVTLHNGQFVHPRSIWAAIRDRRGVMRYQLVQHEPDRFELRLVTADRAAFDNVAAKIQEDLTRQLAGSVVECVYVDDIAIPDGGKFRPVIALRDPGVAR